MVSKANELEGKFQSDDFESVYEITKSRIQTINWLLNKHIVIPGQCSLAFCRRAMNLNVDNGQTDGVYWQCPLKHEKQQFRTNSILGHHTKIELILLVRIMFYYFPHLINARKVAEEITIKF